MSNKDNQYKLDVVEYVSRLSPDTQRKAGVAIQDCIDRGKDWKWIKTAIYKKGYSVWEEFGFGLLFKNSYNASVLETMRLEERAQEFDIDEFLSLLNQKKEYDFPNNQMIADSNVNKMNENQEEQEPTKDAPYFYHAPRGMNEPHREPYEASLFKYYDQVLAKGALELNLPVIEYGLKHNEIDSEYLPFYLEALESYAGDINE